MDICEVSILKAGLNAGNADVAKKYVQRLEQQFKKHEHSEPLGNSIEIKSLIEKCYRVLGNRRN